MSMLLTGKVAIIWVVIAVLAVLNGIVRENVFVPLLDSHIALPLSGLTLSLIVFVVTWICFDLIGQRGKTVYFLIGLQWVLMTLAFEFLFGHFVVGKSWPELLQTFNVLEGDLFTLVLISSFFAPYLLARIKGLIQDNH